MPFYTFKKKGRTRKTFVLQMKISEREEYLKDHPDIEQVYTALNMVDPVTIGVTKPDSGFMKNVIGRMKEKIPKNNIGSRRWDVPKEV